MSRKFPKIFRLITVGADLLTVIISYFVAVDLRNYFLRDGFSIAGYFDFSGLFLLIMLVWWLLLILFDAAEPNRFASLKREIRIGVITTSIGLVVLLALGFLAKYYFPRSLVISFSLTFIVLYIIQKLIGYQLTLKIFQARKIPILVVGTGGRAMEFCARITKTEKASFRFKIVGFLDINEEKIGQKVIGNHHIIGSFRQLPEILKTYMIEEVFFIFRPRDLGYFESLMKVCAEIGITSHLIYNPRKSNPYKGRIDSIAGFPSISYSRLPEKEFSLFTKRMLDIVASGFLLIILSPLFLIIAIIIKLTSKGPVFFPWKVVGRNNRDFVGYKFRTMVENAEELKSSLMDKNEMNGPVFKIKADPRITPFGKWLRKYSLDELPQLWSVLKGDMSLVGPRPPNRNELDRYEFWQRRKISFKPGITCSWQVNGRNSISDFNEWCKLDLEYIDNWSLWLDFKILVKTAWVVVRGTGE